MKFIYDYSEQGDPVDATYVLYYGERGDPVDTTYMRTFGSRQSAVEHASFLQRHGYQIYVLARDADDESDEVDFLEAACPPTVH